MHVSVLGAGVIAPCGTTVEQFWTNLLKGESYESEFTGDDGEFADAPLAVCRVEETTWMDRFSHAERRRLDRCVLMGLAAAEQAVEQAGVLGLVPPDRVSVVAGTGIGGVTTLMKESRLVMERGWRSASPFGVATVMPNALAAFASIRFGVTGSSMAVSTACASGTQALIEGARLIADGSADVVLAGGSESSFPSDVLAGFARAEALASNRHRVGTRSRPFDADRTGFVMGEGAAFVVLANDRVACEATPLARLAGWATTTDAHHITAPDPRGAEALRCLATAVSRAGISPSDVRHVNAHGTGTKLNDRTECATLNRLFGAGTVPVTSIKGAIGHLLGGAGAVEAVAAMFAMRERLVPPTVNCEKIDDELGVDVVMKEPRPIESGAALSCSFGFGGHNSAVVFVPGDE